MQNGGPGLAFSRLVSIRASALHPSEASFPSSNVQETIAQHPGLAERKKKSQAYGYLDFGEKIGPE